MFAFTRSCFRLRIRVSVYGRHFRFRLRVIMSRNLMITSLAREGCDTREIKNILGREIQVDLRSVNYL